METLLDFFIILENEFNNDIFSLRNKIINKINIIKKLYSLYIVPDFSRNDLLKLVNELKHVFTNIVNQQSYDYVKKHYDALNKKLGGIVHNMYTRSGYHILLRNLPKFGKPIEINERETITSHHIYDTLINVFGNDIISNVLQVDDTTYLVKVFRYDDQAKLITGKIDGKQIEDNIILANTIEQKKIDMNDIDEGDDVVEKNDVLSDSWSLRMCKYAFSIVNKVKGLALRIY